MAKVWETARQRPFARRRLYDLRLAYTLQHHGVKTLFTANAKDFNGTGFDKVINPLSA
jgi:hypothetical protein